MADTIKNELGPNDGRGLKPLERDVTGDRDSTAHSAPGYCVRVLSSDLAPRWRLGEYAMVDPEARVDVGDDVLVELASGGRMLRRVAASDANTVTLATYDDRPPAVHARREIAALHAVGGRLTKHPSVSRRRRPARSALRATGGHHD